MKKRTYLAGVTLSATLLVASAGIVSGQTAPSAPPAGGTFAQRLALRKQEQKVQLDERAQDRVTSRCVEAQNIVRQLQQEAGPLLDNREQAYHRIDGILWITIGELKLAEQDTFNLEQERAQLAAKAKTFQTTAEYYIQSLDDITVINCQADPIGFQALLQTARAYHQRIRAQSADIRTYVLDTIKPGIAKHTSELQTRPSIGE